MNTELSKGEETFFQELATLLAKHSADLFLPLLPGDNIEAKVGDSYFSFTTSYDNYAEDRVLIVKRKLTTYVKIKGTK